MEMEEYDYTPPSLFYLISSLANLIICVCAASFIFLTSSDRITVLLPCCFPRLTLRLRDRLIITILLALSCSIACSISAVTAYYVQGAYQCLWAFKVAATFFVLSYYFVSLFLLAKLRAVDEVVTARWYKRFQRVVTLLTYVVLFIFSFIVGGTTGGREVGGINGSHFCWNSVPLWISITFAALQCSGACMFVLLFTMPLVMSEKKRMSAPLSQSLRPVIMRNLISCVVSVSITTISMTMLAVGHGLQKQGNRAPAAWTITVCFFDLPINMMCMFYAIHPAWSRNAVSRSMVETKVETHHITPKGSLSHHPDHHHLHLNSPGPRASGSELTLEREMRAHRVRANNARNFRSSVDEHMSLRLSGVGGQKPISGEIESGGDNDGLLPSPTHKTTTQTITHPSENLMSKSTRNHNNYYHTVPTTTPAHPLSLSQAINRGHLQLIHPNDNNDNNDNNDHNNNIHHDQEEVRSPDIMMHSGRGSGTIFLTHNQSQHLMRGSDDLRPSDDMGVMIGGMGLGTDGRGSSGGSLEGRVSGEGMEGVGGGGSSGSSLNSGAPMRIGNSSHSDGGVSSDDDHHPI